jgi:hypothetical protein
MTPSVAQQAEKKLNYYLSSGVTAWAAGHPCSRWRRSRAAAAGRPSGVRDEAARGGRDRCVDAGDVIVLLQALVAFSALVLGDQLGGDTPQTWAVVTTTALASCALASGSVARARGTAYCRGTNAGARAGGLRFLPSRGWPSRWGGRDIRGLDRFLTRRLNAQSRRRLRGGDATTGAVERGNPWLRGILRG